jgi:hypothetical protein
MNLTKFALTGGVFAVLVFWHFLADWVFQSHAEAMAKSKSNKVRAWHCLKYTVAFLPVLWLLHVPLASYVLVSGMLFFSHFFIDSYVPVILWAKYLRKDPAFSDPNNTTEQAFLKMIEKPIGVILMITMDQFFHIAFLLPIAYHLVDWLT